MEVVRGGGGEITNQSLRDCDSGLKGPLSSPLSLSQQQTTKVTSHPVVQAALWCSFWLVCATLHFNDISVKKLYRGDGATVSKDEAFWKEKNTSSGEKINLWGFFASSLVFFCYSCADLEVLSEWRHLSFWRILQWVLMPSALIWVATGTELWQDLFLLLHNQIQTLT